MIYQQHAMIYQLKWFALWRWHACSSAHCAADVFVVWSRRSSSTKTACRPTSPSPRCAESIAVFSVRSMSGPSHSAWSGLSALCFWCATRPISSSGKLSSGNTAGADACSITPDSRFSIKAFNNVWRQSCASSRISWLCRPSWPSRP